MTDPQIIPLTDEELIAVADDPSLLGKLTSEERRRLSRLKPEARTWTDTAIDAIPAVGGALGGIVGGLGGTVAGFGVGGVPGAVGGAAVGGAGGEGIRQAIQTWRGKEAPRTPVEALTDVGTEGVIQGGMEAAGGAIVKGAGAAGKAIYRGYLKPSLAKQSLGKADTIVRTALDEALPITKTGEATAGRVIKELRREVDGILERTGGEIDLKTVADKVRAFARQRYYKPGRSTADFEAAMDVANRIDAHPSLPLPEGAAFDAPPVTTVSASKANQVKRGIDESVGESNFGVERGATKTTEKIARRTLRQAIEQLAPEVGPINAREGRLIDAAKALSRAVGRESNKSPLIGVNTIASGAVGFGASGDPFVAAATALATRMALTPEVMSRVAIVAHQLGKTSGSAPASVARAALVAVLESQQEQPEEVTQP